VAVGRYALELEALSQERFDNYNALVAKIKVLDRDSGEMLSYMFPERRGYKASGESTTEVDIRSTLREDLYLALAGLDIKAEGKNAAAEIDVANAPALLKVFINPLQVWLWFGAVVVLVGSSVIIGHGLLSRPAPVEISVSGPVNARA
jgi:cytochrome c-type biogenesis protein CcmF